MDESREALIAVVLGLACVGIVLYEFMKRFEFDLTWEKLAALGIAACYLVAALIVEPAAAWAMLVFLAVPMGLIWFGDELGEMTGMSTRGGRINKRSPGFLVRLFGWGLLLAPIGMGIFELLNSAG